MTKKRVIPTILTDGISVVKGSNFNNWRTVGSIESIARLYSVRDVDELLFLDIGARSRQNCISLDLINTFSRILNIPFSVGGGIDNLSQIRACFRSGAEKIVLGTAAIRNPELISDAANEFGSQAIIVAVDLIRTKEHGICIENGNVEVPWLADEVLTQMEALGAGEILLQCKELDGTMSGYNLEAIGQLSKVVRIPVIASSGCSGYEDAFKAITSGASAVAAGALFQFTENTPAGMRTFLADKGIPMRIN